MKKALIIMAAAAMLFVGKANAQLGVNVGYAPQTIATVNGNSHDTVSMDGFFVGFNYNNPVGNGLNLSVGLQGRYNTKSETQTIDGGFLGSFNATANSSQLLVDVPVLLNYSIPLNSDIKLTLFAGPTVSYAIFGKTKWEANASVLNLLNLGGDGEDDWYEESDKYSQLDVSATIGVSLGFKGFRLYGGYNMGLLDLSSADNTTRKASNLFAGLGITL